MAIVANAFSKLLAPVARCCRMLLLPESVQGGGWEELVRHYSKLLYKLPVARRAHDPHRVPRAGPG